MNPDTALRGLRSWSPSSSQSTRIAGESAIARHLLARPERIARALADQRRRRQRLEMPGPQLLRPARRMERIAEAEEPRDRPAACSSSATMLATRPPIDLPPMTSRPGAASSATAARYSGISVSARGGGRRTPLPPARHVAELEARHPQPRRRQRPRRRGHRRRIHRRAGAVREQHRHRRAPSGPSRRKSVTQPASRAAAGPRTACPAPPSAPTPSRVELQVALPPAPRRRELARLELQRREVEDRVGIVGIELDRPLAGAAAPPPPAPAPPPPRPG